MISAFGVEHGEGIAKAMTPNKLKAFKAMTSDDYLAGEKLTTKRVSDYGYARDKLTAHQKGKRARQAPKPANPGGWMSSGNKIAHQGREAAQSAKQTESIRSSNYGFRRLP